jgi:drug/metabolite transporter (DMT)-like permease
MNWLFFAFIAQFIAGSAAIFDKLLYKKVYKNPLGYTFWLGILGLFSLAFIPFGAKINPSSIQFLIALAAGATFIGAMFFYFKAIFIGETSSRAVLISAISPIFTLIASSFLLGESLDTLRALIFILLIAGGIVLFFVENKSIRFKTLIFSLASALFFGITYTLTKYLFNQTGFLTGFMWTKLGAVVTVLLLLVISSWRKTIFNSQPEEKMKSPALYFANRIYAGLGSIVIYYAASLGPVALVNATENLKYLFIFIGGWLLLKEHFKGWALIGKIVAFILIALGISGLAGVEYYASHPPDPNRPISWGVTFSQKYAENINLNWKDAYDAVINDLNPQKIRLIAYWDVIEPKEGEFDFSTLDYQINLANQKNIEITLAIGQRVPRWPECHFPDWTNKLSGPDRDQKLISYMQKVLDRYKDIPNISYIQVENEPFLKFGNCPDINIDTLNSEIALTKNILPDKPILTTDGGEFGLWYKAADIGDVFGTTMYRRVHSDTWGYFDYHLPPEYFRLKSKIVRLITGKPDQQYFVIELGAEPWMILYPIYVPAQEQLKYFDMDFFKSTIAYAKLAGFNEYYLWGAEWWYWMKTTQNHPEFWDYAKEVLSRSN